MYTYLKLTIKLLQITTVKLTRCTTKNILKYEDNTTDLNNTAVPTDKTVKVLQALKRKIILSFI
jgi:hypothetical protein